MLVAILCGVSSNALGETVKLSIEEYARQNNWSNGIQYLSATIGVVNFSKSSTGGNTGSYYSADNTWRFYANEGAKLIISVPEGYSLVSVTPTFTVKDNGTLLYNSSTCTSGKEVSVSGTSVEFTISQSSGNKGKIFFTEIAVTYEAPIPAYTITAVSNDVSYGTVSLSGTTITATPAEGYTYADPAYTVFPANSATVVQDGNAFSVTPSANTTVTINFEAIPTYTVTLSDDNSTLTETIGGAGVTLPTRSVLNGYDFAGWSATNVSTETTTAPTIIPAGSYTPTANITLYPIYTKTGGGTTPSAFSVGNTGNYAIVSAEQSGKYYALPTSPTVSSGKITAQEITVSESNGVKYITTANANGFTWTIASDNNGYTLSDGSKYIYHSNGGASGTNLAYGTSTSYTWAFTADGDYVTMAGMNGSTINNRGLLFSGTTIGGYALSNANSSGYYKVMILPISAGSTTYYWSSPKAAVVEIPTIVIAENPFLFSTTATITCATDGATIKYSFDGENWSEYSSSLTITETKTIYAKAIKGENESDVTQVTATKNLAMPTVTVSGDLTLDLDGKTNVNAGTLTATVTYNDAAVDGAAVTWSSSNTDVATIDASTGAVTLLTTGTVTFTATYVGNSDYAEATGTKTVTVINNKAPGSEGKPYTVAQARAAIDASTGTQGVYATGIVCKASTSLYSNKYLSYFISDDGTTDSPQLEAYNGLGKDGANFTSADDIQVGDEVVIYGNLTKYNSTYEFAANNKLISLVRNTLSAPTFSVAAGTYKEAQSVEITCATEDATIYYRFDNENWTLYENPITISESKTLYAKAVKGDKEETACAQYVILIDTAIEGYKYVKVTSTEDITDGQYLIVYEDGTNSVAFDGGLETLDAVSNTVSVTISNNEIAASTFMQAAEFTIDVTNGTIKSASGKYIGINSYSNGLDSSDEEIENGISIDDSGNANIVVTTTGGNMSLRFNKASNQERFRYYKSGQEAIQLYKLVEIVSPVVAPAKPIIFHDGGEGVTYEGELSVPMFAEEGATIYYTTDGSEPTTESTPYTEPLKINDTTNPTTVKAIAVKDGVTSGVVEKVYTIVEKAKGAVVEDGYYTIQNNDDKYVNVAGRKTVTLVSDTKSAGTVIRVKADEDGVKVLRSQAVDLPRYAERAMSYVPELVKELMKRLSENVENPIIGEDGANLITDEVMDLDYNLYLEEADGGYRIYGKTPSMQRVVDFYATNKTIIDERLPRLEEFVEDVLLKVAERLDHPNSEWASKFKILDIWAKLVVTNPDLTKPEEGNAEAISKFYTEILSSEANVWNFAHETMMIYWTKVEKLINPDPDSDSESDFADMLENLGDYKKYLEKVPNILPNFKYYIVSDGSGIDFISEGNEDIINNAARTVWTLTPRTEFDVTFLKDNALSSGRELYTTLYTDFAYKLPDGVKAYAITGVNETTGVATKEEFPSNIIPAQTPVLLQATFDAEQTADQTKTLELTTEAGTTPETNLLVGADYLINEYEINSPTAEGMFTILATLSQSLADKYEYLKRKNAGTVNNKYFFGLDDADLDLCVENKDCVVRNLGTGENQPLAFYGDWQAPKSNQAFLVSETFNPILLTLKGDVYRDGVIDNKDLTALVEIVLGKVTLENKPENYDFDAAHVNEDEDINIADVTALVNILKPQPQTNN